MAKKDEVDFGMDDLDAFNFDDFGDIGDDGFEPSSAKSRKPVDEFKKGAKSGAKSAIRDRMLDPGLMRRLLGAALPKGYNQAFNAYDALSTAAVDIYKDNQGELDPYMRKAALRADRGSKTAQRFLPKALREMFNSAKESEHTGGGYQEQDELAGNIGGLDDLLKLQLSQKMSDDVSNATADIRGKKRFTAEMGARIQIGKGIGRLVSFNDSVTINYYRKSLETGYRQLDVQVKTLKASQGFYSDAKALLDAIRHNSALPDYVKLKGSEIVKQQMMARLAQGAMKSAGNFAADYFKKIKGNASDFVGNAMSLKGQLDDAAQMGQSRAGMAGQMVGQVAGEAISGGAEYLGGMLADKAAPYLAKIPGLKKGGNFLRKNLTNVPQRMNDYAKSETTREGIGGLLEEALKAVLDSHSPTASIGGAKLTALDQPAVFDNLFHRSVTDIMPGFLASIDRSLRTMVTGEDQEENAYSHYTGGFVSRTTLNQQHARIALKDGDKGGVRAQVDGLLREMGASELSAEAKKVLRRRLMKDMQSAHDFKPERYVKLDVWSHAPEPIAQELIEFFADTFGLDPDGQKVRTSDEMDTKLADVRQSFGDLTQRLPDYGEKMNILQNAVGRRSWREMGLSTYNGNEGDSINLDNLYDLIVNNDDDGDAAKPQEEKKKFKFGSKEEMAAQLRDRMKRKEGTKDSPTGDLVDTSQAGKIGGLFGGGAPPVPVATPANAPKIEAEVKFPELMNVNDELTHERLEKMIELSNDTNTLLNLISQMNFGGGGGGGEGDTDGGGGPAPGPAKKKWSLLGLGWKGAKMGVKGIGKYIGGSYKLMWKGTKLATKLGIGAAKLPFKSIKGLGVTDVHVQGDPEPALTARNIRRGFYFDVNTQKVIESVKDITGEVKNRDGEVVLSAEDFEKGLMSGDGESLAGWGLRKAGKIGLGAAKGLGAYFKFTYGSMFKAAKWVVGKVADQFTQFDAYLPGDEKPRIRSTLMKKGYYRDKDGTPIMKLDDIKGAVFDMEGNEIVSDEEIQKYKSFYTRNGSLLFTIGKTAISLSAKALNLAGKFAKGYAKLSLKMYKGLWKGSKAIVGGAWNLLRGRGLRGNKGGGKGAAMGEGDPELANANFEIAIEQLGVQRSILQLLQKQYEGSHVKGDLDGDGVKENSWRDMLNRRKGKLAGPAPGENGDVVDAIRKLEHSLEDKLDEVIDTTEEAGEESLLDQAGDLADMKGRGKGGKRGFRSGKGIRGKIGKWGGKAGRAMGRGLKRLPGGKMLGQGAKLAGRGAMAGGRLAMTGGRMALMAGVEALPWLATGASAAAGAVGTAAAATAGAVATGAAAVGTGLMAAGSAVLSVLSLPVLLGIAVVGGAAYLGYKYYKAEKAKDFPLLYLRMTQYGVDPTSQSRVEQVLQLEGMLAKGVRIDNAGAGSIDRSVLDMAAIYKVFGINDPERDASMAKWIQTRFRPIFLAHSAAMNRIRGSTDLVSADKGVGDGDLDTFLSAVDIGGMQDVYNNMDASPFDSSLDTDADDVASAIKMVRERRKKATEKDANKTQNALMIGNKEEAAKTAKVGVSAGGTGDVGEIADSLKLNNARGMMRGGAAYGGVNSAVSQMKALDIPTAVRFKAYGLKDFTLEHCQNLDAAEKVYWAKTQFKGTDSAMIDGDASAYEAQIIGIFKPSGDPQKEDVLQWLRNRFLPVFLQYCISCRRRYNGDVRDAAKNLTGPAMREVLDEVTRAQTETKLGESSVWSVMNSPWEGLLPETLVGSTKLYIDALDKGDSSKVLDVSGLNAQKNYAASNKEYGSILTNTALGNTKTQAGTLGNSGSTMANYGKIYGAGAVAGGVAGQSSTGKGDGSLLYNGSFGSKVEHQGGGTGGDINSLPNATGKGWQAMGPLIQAAAKMVGFDPVIAGNVAAVESNLDPNASSGIANGLFQFIDGTWQSMLKKYGPIYGISPNASPMDPRANAILGACYLKENTETLQSSLGKDITDLDLYMAHFLGPGGAKKFLSAPRGEASYKYVGSGVEWTGTKVKGQDNAVIDGNKSIFFKDGKGPQGGYRNVGEVLAEMDRRMNIGRKKTGAPLSATAASLSPSAVPPTAGASGGEPANGGAASSGAGPAPGPTSTDVGGLGGEVTGEAADAPTGPGAAMAAAAAKTAATGAGGSGGSTSASPSPGSAMSAATAAEVTSTMPTGPSMDTPPPPTPMGPSPTRAAAESSQSTQAAATAAGGGDVASVLGSLLKVNQSSDKTLTIISEQLGQLLLKGGSNNAPTGPVPLKAPEPQRRATVNTQRGQAVT